MAEELKVVVDLSTVPEPGWKHAVNAVSFRPGAVFGWHENGRLWSGIVEEIDHMAFRVRVRDVLPAVIR